VIARLNLCGRNQLLFLPFCLWPTLRDRVGFKFALLSGLVFGSLPLTVRNALRFASGSTIDMRNDTARAHAISWTACALIFFVLAWICTFISGRAGKWDLRHDVTSHT
jgi:hypothetical protein